MSCKHPPCSFSRIQTNVTTSSLDAGLSFLSVSLNYTNPLFLKYVVLFAMFVLLLISLSRLILSEIESGKDNPSGADKSKAYLYATLMFTCALLKAQADAQHLWFGRRAGTRIRSELMAAIYDKALKRKDYSGIIVEKEDAPDASGTWKFSIQQTPTNFLTLAKNAKPKAEDKNAGAPKAGADVGKIVNLMAGDANTVSYRLSAFYEFR